MEILTRCLLLPFALDVAVEISVAVLLGFTGRQKIATIFFLNLMTNPATNTALLLNTYFHPIDYKLAVAVLEVLVAAVEWLALNSLFPGNIRRMLLLSLFMNAASFLAGLLLL
jgi:hypothetical protein